MANFTKRAIKDTFISLLEEHPLSKITVKDICEQCGINRNSFYYHFEDITALIDDIVKEEAEGIIKKHPNVDSMVKCFDALIEFSSGHKRAIMHIYRSVSREVFEKHLINLSEYFITQYINSINESISIKDSEKKILIEYYKYVFLGVILGWLNNGMTDEYTASVRKIFNIKKDHVVEIGELLSKQM